MFISSYHTFRVAVIFSIAIFLAAPNASRSASLCINGDTCSIGGNVFSVQNAGHDYSNYTRFDHGEPQWFFELLPGDRWDSDPKRVERTEFAGKSWPKYQPMWTSFSVKLVNFTPSGKWVVIGQWHGSDADGRSPYIAIEVENKDIVLRYRYTESAKPKGQSGARVLYRIKNVNREEWYNFKIEHRVGERDGQLSAWVNGRKVACYSGPLGYWDHRSTGYWKFGIYRSTANYKMVVAYKGVIIRAMRRDPSP